MSRGARFSPHTLVRALVATTCVVACEPTDEVVFSGPDASAGGTQGSGGTGGASGGTPATGGVLTGGTATGGVATGGVATGGMPHATGGVVSSGGTVATGGSGTAPVQCETSASCERTEICNKARCGDRFGTCELTPLVCPAGGPENAVCGCDGITYWNDCLRLQHRVPSSRPGECRNDGLRCFAAQDCRRAAPDAECALFLTFIDNCNDIPPPPQPPAPPPGTCWVPPPTCSPSGSEQKWQRCSPFAPPVPCIGFCQAVQEPGLYVVNPPNSCPP